MAKRCSKCNIDVENELVCCPNCKGELTDSTVATPTLSEDQVNKIVGLAVVQTSKKMWKRLWISISVIAFGSFLYSGWTLDNLFKKAVTILENRLINKIDQEFETERIKDTVTTVAKNESKELMSSAIKPEIDSFKEQTNLKVENFNNFINELETDYKEQYLVLKREVEKLKNRNEINKLGERAMLHDGAEALNELAKITFGATDNSLPADTKKEFEALRIMARSMINNITDYYINVTYIKNFDLVYTDDNDQKIENEKISTEELLKFLKHDDFHHRAKAAQLLRNRKDIKVMEALFERILNDTDIEVQKEANKSFCALTGFKAGDIPMWPFVELHKLYWAKNKERIEKEIIENKNVEPN